MTRQPNLGKDEECLALYQQGGKTWKEVADLVGYKDRSGALHAAQRATRASGGSRGRPGRAHSHHETLGPRQDDTKQVVGWVISVSCDCGAFENVDCDEQGRLLACTSFVQRHEGHRMRAIGQPDPEWAMLI